jgi:AcrR family transcriptional regulator
MDTRAAASEATRERIVDAATDAFSTQWYGDVTVRGVAADAGVALQTVRNHFASKDDLFLAAIERIASGIDEVRWAVVPGDLEGAITTLTEDYERNGDANLRLLAVEAQVSVVQPVMARGRKGHEAWVEHVFADSLSGLGKEARSRRVAQLVVATDVYTWKLLRRDRDFDRNETIAAVCGIVRALLNEEGNC